MQLTYLLIRRFRWLALLACAVCAFACSSSELDSTEEPAGEPVEVTLRIRTRSEAAPEPLSNESTLQTLRIYAFAAEKLVGYHFVDLTAQSSVTDRQTIRMKLPATSVTFYAIGNEAAAGKLQVKDQTGDFTLPTPPNEDLTTVKLQPADLDNLTFSTLPEPTYQSGGTGKDDKDESEKLYSLPYLPMGVKKTVQVTTNLHIDLPLQRSVAKLNFQFAKVGVPDDKLYMGRGLYLYNQPPYGYLFPRELPIQDFPADAFHHLEKTKDEGGDNSDSQLFQQNGRVILRSAWPDETEADKGKENKATHINEIVRVVNTPSGESTTVPYQELPQRPYYLFANPYQVSAKDNLPTNPKEDSQKGYYVKILSHYHKAGYDGTGPGEITYTSSVHYVSLPVVKANDQLQVKVAIRIDGYVSLWPDWQIAPWTEAGGEVSFE